MVRHYIRSLLMQSKKIITALLVLVMAFQLLPVRQAVKYFLIDNVAAEEIEALEKADSETFGFWDDTSKLLPDAHALFHWANLAHKTASFHYEEALPLQHVADIPTPPPDIAGPSSL